MNPKFASTFTLLLVLCSTSVLGKRLIVRLSAPPLAEYPGYAKLRHKKLSAMNSIDATTLGSIKEAVFLQQKKLITSLPKEWSVSKLLTENGLKVSKYHVLLNAVVINVPDTEAKYAERILSKVPGVVSVSEVRYFKTNLHTSREAINALAAWKALNSTEKDAGRGIKIAVVDTGIYTPNALFNDINMEYPIDGGYPLGEVENCNKKVIASRLYLDPNGTIASYDNHSYPSEEASAHGTHCASTAAGSFAETDYDGVKLNLTGVAPGPWLMNYRIFHVDADDYEECVSDEQIIQAFEDLIKDGADIVSNSWGSTALYSYGTALDVAIKSLTLLNVPMIFAAGNDGPEEVTVDSHFPALRVGATTSGAKLAYKITATPSIGKDIEYVLARNCSRFNGTFKLYAANETNSYGCKPFPYTFSSDENAAIVMLYGGGCIPERKINNTASTGAKLAIVISDDGDAFTMTPKYLATNAVCVGSEGIDLIEMARNQTDMSVEVFSVLDVISVDKDVLASFSSRGPTVDMALAPDLCAPGVKIYAAGYGSVGDGRMGFGQISGTSMACPHVSGASALVLAEHPDFTTFEVYSALMSTANYKDVMDYDGTPGQPLSAGAGRIDVAKAINPTLYLNPQSLSFSLIPMDKSEKLEFTAKNYLNTPVTLSIKAVHHVDKGVVEDAPTWVIVEPSTVVIPGGGEVTVAVIIDAINGEIGDEQGYIVLEDSNTNEEVAHLPYWARVVYKESDRVDVYLVDADMSECWDLTDYKDRYTSVLNASGITYKVLDICDDDEVLEAAFDELLCLKSRSVIVFSGDEYTYLYSAKALLRQVLHSGVPVILMGSNMPYSWGLYDGLIWAYGLPYEFRASFQTRDKVIKRVKAGAYAPWTMKSLEFRTNFSTRPLRTISNRILMDGNNNTLAIAAYSFPSIYDIEDDAKMNSFAIFSVVGLESINSTEHSTTLLMGLYNYSISSINCSVVSEKKSVFEYKVNVKCDGNISYLGINWGDRHISRKPYCNVNEYGTYHKYSDVGTYSIRVIVRSIYGKYFELEPVKINVDGVTSSSSSPSSSSSSSSTSSAHSSISSSTFNSKSSLPLSLSTSSSYYKSDSFGKTTPKFALIVIMPMLLFFI